MAGANATKAQHEVALTIPAFYCPIEGARHPAVEAIERRCVEWIDQFQFCKTPAERTWLLASFSADFCARFAPRGTFDGLLLYAQWVYWAFAFDDAFCDEGPMSTDPGAFGIYAGQVQRALEVSCSSEGPDNSDLVHKDPYIAALCDIGYRARRLATPTQRRRLLDNHRRWLFGVQWQISNRAKKLTPGLDDYFGMRLGSCAGALTLGWIEIANQTEVPPAEMDLPAVQALTEMASLVAAMDNDRHSLPKDTVLDLADQNFAIVIAQHHHLDINQALQDAIAIRDRILVRFIDLRAQVRPNASEALGQYLDNLGHAVRGNADWGMRVTRYHNYADRCTAPELIYTNQHLNWAAQPADKRTDSLPYPSLRWWWDDNLVVGNVSESSPTGTNRRI